LSNVTYWAGHRQAGAPMTNIQSTLRTATDLRQNVLLALLFSSNGNSYIYIYIYIHIYIHIYIIHIHIWFIIIRNQICV